MELMVLADATVSISIGPFEGLGAFVVDFDIGSNFAGKALDVKMPRVIKSR
jgi:hypothetical protein